jgi:hypothetical protein
MSVPGESPPFPGEGGSQLDMVVRARPASSTPAEVAGALARAGRC